MSLSNLKMSGRLGLFIVLACSACAGSYGQSVNPAITLDPADDHESSAAMVSITDKAFAHAPANFRNLGTAQAGSLADAQKLTLRFSAESKLLKIESTPDFRVEQGSSCVEGDVYAAKTTCTLLVRFTPQGAGRRQGKLVITHTADATPMYVGLGGYGYTPVVSFTPGILSTVPGTLVGTTGLLKSALTLAVDGGDTLYVADTGNNLIRYIDSSAKIRTLATTSQAPVGVAVDTFGQVYFSEPTANMLYEIYAYGPVVQASGSGTDSCPYSAPCHLSSEKMYSPGQMAMDNNNQLFFAEGGEGAAVSAVQPTAATFARLYDPFIYQEVGYDAFAVDANDTLYSYWNNGTVCAIESQYFSDAANSRVNITKVAGGHACGYSGDNGQARNAEIGASIGQITFDIAGNLYFSDTANQRVRRIDRTTGVISTVAGSGSTGYKGDGGPADSAAVTAPTGVAVDSQGQVYVISTSAATGTAQVIRKVGPDGAVTFFTAQLKGTAAPTKRLTIANSGNSALNINNIVINGANPGDFSFDTSLTSCNFAAGNALAGGQSCKLGIIFKPTTSGTRTANITIADNTIPGVHYVRLTGTGTLTAPAVKITAPTSGATVTAGTTPKFSVSVTSASGTAPTGKVTFKVDGASFGSPVALAAGAASVSLTGLTTQSHTLSATYSGDANYLAATVSETLVVKAAAISPSTVQLSAKANPATTGSPIVFVAQVQSASGTPKGVVHLQEGTTLLATGTISANATALTVPKLSPGTHTLTAIYGGDEEHLAASSTPFKEIVK
jgi:Bacterial Ig-like domain (group 3)